VAALRHESHKRRADVIDIHAAIVEEAARAGEDLKFDGEREMTIVATRDRRRCRAG
jgi:hypothetical protein